MYTLAREYMVVPLTEIGSTDKVFIGHNEFITFIGHQVDVQG